MRLIPILVLFVAPLWAGEPDIATRFPAGPTAYLEARGLAGKVDALLASPLGESLRAHPALQAFRDSDAGRRAQLGEAFLQGAMGMDFRGLLRALAGRQIGLAVYGVPQRSVLIAETGGDTARRILAGVELLTQLERVEIASADDRGPALWQVGPAFVCVDGDLLMVSGDQILALSMRERSALGLGGDADLEAARRQLGDDADLFGYLELDAFRDRLQAAGKPKDLGQALLLGAMPHALADAPWAALGLGLEQSDNSWRIRLRGIVPLADEPAAEVAQSFLGTLDPLPFALPPGTLGVVRMHRDLEAVWAHRDLLIDEAGLAPLVEFETNFGNLTGGMSWVEEFLPNVGEEFVLIGTRHEYGPEEAAPAVRYPEGAILWPVREPELFSTRLQLAYQTLVFILNQQQAQNNGTPLLSTTRDYRGVRYHTAHYMPPHAAEMEGRTDLPRRYNFSPSAAVVGDHVVIASTERVLKRLIDAREGSSPALAGVNAGLWIQPAELRALLAENREALIANAMLKEGDSRREAERKIDLALELGRFLRSFAVTAEERPGAVGVRFEAILGPAGS